MLLSVDNLRVSYEKIKALHGIGFRIDEGGVVWIMGANGRGESSTPRGSSPLVPKADPVKSLDFFVGNPQVIHRQQHQVALSLPR